MNDALSTLFRGQAHFKVLELLSTRTQPVRLRTLAELAGMYVRSIELALAYLLKRHVVTRSIKNGLILFSLNLDHPQSSLLRNIFYLVKEEQRGQTNCLLNKRARETLAFCDSAIKLFQTAKR